MYGINQGDLALNSGNYDLSYQGNNLTITKALLNVIADGKTKVYGDADPSLIFGFVEQVEDAQRSDRRLQTGAGGVEQIFAGCAAVQVEGGAAGMLVALRGASQGDEGGRGLCGSMPGRPG